MKTFFVPLAVGAIVVAGSLPPAAAETQPVEFEPAPKSAHPNPPDAAISADSSSSAASGNPVALNFDPPGSPSNTSTADGATVPPKDAPAPSAASGSDKDLFAGGSESVVARVVGAAEGTRTADGGHTDLYEGHTDPGNGVWNRGTFSYQFGNEENLSAEEADRRQMAKIKRIYESVMLSKAQQNGVAPLTLSEELNGIDMINQAPLAVTEDGGYIERLAEAKKQKGLNGTEAILEARVWSFWDPQRNSWDAPGLRAYDDMGKEASVRHDQQRRMGMISDALDDYQAEHGAIAHDSSPSQTEPPTAPASAKKTATHPTPARAVADAIIFPTANSNLTAQNNVAPSVSADSSAQALSIQPTAATH